MRNEPDQTFSRTERATRLRSGLALLARDPRSLRFTVPYVRSLAASRSPLEDGIPWLTYPAVAWLRRRLSPEMKVFEYGSGGSTIFFARRVREVVSVEHDSGWHALTGRALEELRLRNVDYLLRKPTADSDSSYASTDPVYRGLSFEAYVKSIDSHPDGTFDLVVVDGRARPACVLRAIPKVRPGGYLLLDDSDRPYYREGVDALAEHSRLDFRGVAPYKTEAGQTSIWKIDGGSAVGG